jgi:hypothetical protein
MENGEEGRKSSGEGGEGRGNGEGEEGQTGSTQASRCLPDGGATTSSSLSAICSATLYPPNRCLRMNHRVRLAALIRSFTAASKSRCVRIANGPSGHLLLAGSMRLHAAPFPGRLRGHKLGSSHLEPGVRIRRPVVLSFPFSTE